MGKCVTVDLDELAFALEDASLEHTYYLDTETGEVVLTSDYWDSDELERQRKEIEADQSDRFRTLPRADSREGYQDIEDFIATVRDGRLRELLEVAIEGRGAFRRFKDGLARYPTEQERWFTFQKERLRERVLRWLAEEEIEPIPIMR